MIQIDSQIENNITTLTVNGDIDASSSIQLDDAMKKVLDDGATKLLLDCHHLNYISSAGLGVFMSYLEEINEKEIKMAIYGLNDKVHNVFEILGLDQLLVITKDKNEAINYVNEA